MPAYKYGVAIVTRDRPDLLYRCLEHLTAAMGDKRAPIIVWNNGTDEKTPILCAEYGVKMLGGDGENTSFSKANNECAKQFKGDVLLVNNDVYLTPGAIDALIAERQNGCDIVGAKLLYPNGRVQHFGVGFSRDWQPFHLGRHEPSDSEWCSEPHVVRAVTFALALINRLAWDRLEGLDEQYFFGYEDIDFCLRAGLSGDVIGVTPDAVAVHLESQSEGRSSHDARNWNVFKSGWVDGGHIHPALGVWPAYISNTLRKLKGPDHMLHPVGAE